MSLFTKLLRLHGARRPLEDFFTEVVAAVLRRRPRLLVDWLRLIDAADDPDATVDFISTQKEYAALESHNSGSRPDLAIGLTTDRGRTRILIESKVGSSEGPEQLQRYADLLKEENADRRVLIYCTRDYDPKEPEEAWSSSERPVHFRSARWHTLYAVLDGHREDPIVEEVCLFMEEYDMSQDGLFTPADVAALERFPTSLALMKQAVWGEVSRDVERVIGKRPSERSSNAQLGHHGRYLLKIDMRDKWWFGLGFFLARARAAYPNVGVVLETNPSSPRVAEIRRAMEDISARPGWTSYNLREEGSWFGVQRVEALNHFLHMENHVDAIEEFFLGLLNEIREIRAEWSELPWLPSDTDSDDPED
jgi:hypothetical protein